MNYLNMMHYLLSSVQEMHRIMRWQNEQMLKMEKELLSMKEQLQGLGPQTRVDKIEYNFEQLKVETLDGTLVIGISPGDTGIIDNWAVQDKTGEDTPMDEEWDNDKIHQQTRESMIAYINESIPAMLDRSSEEMDVPLSSDNKYAIIEDMNRQLDGRITYHLHRIEYNKGDSQAKYMAQLTDAMKNDIQQALHAYIDHFRKEENDGQ